MQTALPHHTHRIPGEPRGTVRGAASPARAASQYFITQGRPPNKSRLKARDRERAQIGRRPWIQRTDIYVCISSFERAKVAGAFSGGVYASQNDWFGFDLKRYRDELPRDIVAEGLRGWLVLFSALWRNWVFGGIRVSAVAKGFDEDVSKE